MAIIGAMEIDWKNLRPDEIRATGVPAFGAGDLKRYYYGPENRFLVDIRKEGDREVVERAFDVLENRTVWPPPKRADDRRPAVRRIEWQGGAKRGAGTIRLDHADLERLREALGRAEAGHVDLPLRWER